MGDVQFWVECATRGERFGRGAGGALTTPEVAAEYQREQVRVIAAKIQAVCARRALEAAQRAAAVEAAAAPDPTTARDSGSSSPTDVAGR